jgi:hypothetical protein
MRGGFWFLARNCGRRFGRPAKNGSELLSGCLLLSRQTIKRDKLHTFRGLHKLIVTKNVIVELVCRRTNLKHEHAIGDDQRKALVPEYPGSYDDTRINMIDL